MKIVPSLISARSYRQPVDFPMLADISVFLGALSAISSRGIPRRGCRLGVIRGAVDQFRGPTAWVLPTVSGPYGAVCPTFVGWTFI